MTKPVLWVILVILLAACSRQPLQVTWENGSATIEADNPLVMDYRKSSDPAQKEQIRQELFRKQILPLILEQEAPEDSILRYLLRARTEKEEALDYQAWLTRNYQFTATYYRILYLTRLIRRDWNEERIKTESMFIENIAAGIRTQADLRSAIERYSDDPEKVSNQGLSGLIPEWYLEPQFKTALESLKIGEIYPKPLATRYGFYIISLADRQKIASRELGRWITDPETVKSILKEKQSLYLDELLGSSKKTAAISVTRDFEGRLQILDGNTVYLEGVELLYRSVYEKLETAELERFEWSPDFLTRYSINPEEWAKTSGTREALIRHLRLEDKKISDPAGLRKKIASVREEILKLYLNRQIMKKIPELTDDELLSFYRLHEKDDFASRSFSQVKDQIRSRLFAESYDKTYRQFVEEYYQRYPLTAGR